MRRLRKISTHAPAGGATCRTIGEFPKLDNFYSRPCGRGDPHSGSCFPLIIYFYSRPCGRGDQGDAKLHPTRAGNFYSRPCGRGDGIPAAICREIAHFYSRPCGRGDFDRLRKFAEADKISTHAPAGGATLF